MFGLALAGWVVEGSDVGRRTEYVTNQARKRTITSTMVQAEKEMGERNGGQRMGGEGRGEGGPVDYSVCRSWDVFASRDGAMGNGSREGGAGQKGSYGGRIFRKDEMLLGFPEAGRDGWHVVRDVLPCFLESSSHDCVFIVVGCGGGGGGCRQTDRQAGGQ